MRRSRIPGTTYAPVASDYLNDGGRKHDPNKIRRLAFQRARVTAAVEVARASTGRKPDAAQVQKFREQLDKRVRQRAAAAAASRRPRGDDRLQMFRDGLAARLPARGARRSKPAAVEIPGLVRAALAKPRSPTVKASRGAVARNVGFIVETTSPVSTAELEERLRNSLGFDSKDALKKAGIQIAPLCPNLRPNECFHVDIGLPRSALPFSPGQLGATLKDALPVRRFTSLPTRDIRRYFREVDAYACAVQPTRNTGVTTFACCCCCPESGSLGDEVVPGTARPTFRSTPDDTEWHLKQTRVKAAWALNAPSGSSGRGEGVVIGHPDTGWLEHPEFGRDNLDFDRARNVLTGENGRNATRHGTLTIPPLVYQTHGTGTGATMVGKVATGETLVQDIPDNQETPTTSPVELSGVAPLATLIPIRFTDTPILVMDTNIHPAIEHAISSGCHVISLSVGGILDSSVEDLIDRAVLEENIIVVAAAGQFVDWASMGRSVVEPGSFTNVIAAAGSRPDATPWPDSGHGPNVDIAAPGFDVWYPHFALDGTTGIYIGLGTSFSAAQISGVAALWLSHWGRKNLIEKYRGVPLAHVFRHLLRKTAWRPPIWDSQWGPGIVDAYALLREPLPDPSQVITPRKEDVSTFDFVSDALETGGDFFEAVIGAVVGGAGAIGDFVGGVLNVEEIMAGLAELMASAEDLGADLQDWAEDRLDEIGGFLDESVDAAVDVMEDLAEAGEDAAEAVGDFLEETGEVIEDVAEDAAEVWDDTVDLVGDLLGLGDS